MEALLVSAATGALKPVLGKLGALLGDEYVRFKGVRKEIKSLTHELAAMDAFLMKMSEEEDPDVQDKVWMNEVRELSYFMEDCIDDFMQTVDDKDTKPDSFMENMKRSLGKLRKMKARGRIGSQIHDLRKQISEVGERNMRYKTREAFCKTINETVDPRALAMFEDVSNLVGIDEPKDEIIKLLTEGVSTRQQQPKLVSIVGTGGIGKTTLANQVYQHLKGNFECRSFLSVSRNPDMMNIFRTILSEVSGQGYATTEAGSTQQLISKITDFLAGKRYFVVVDDIWDMDAWDVIKLAFPMTSSGSIIITTTRINGVAESCRSSFSGDIYGIRPLNVVHSRKLFQRRLFNSNEDCPAHLAKVCDEILRKCDGLPLAIIAISGLLANRERTNYLWEQVKYSIGCALERNPSVERMMKILSLSYFDLPPYLKTCLLYMSIFPEDTFIERKSLIRRWIAEGFIHKEDRYTTHAIGKRYFNELLNRGLIQPGKTNEYGKVKSCRVHDTILDFIISKSKEENFVTLVGVPMLTIGTQSKVVRRLSLQGIQERPRLSLRGIQEGHPLYLQGIQERPRLSLRGINQGNSTMSTTGLVLSHVRSLNVFGHSMEIPSLEESKHLRVLDLKRSGQLEDHHLKNIVKLLHLKYLNLQYNSIHYLPRQIGHLVCLEIMDLRRNDIVELPASIVNLRKLSHLFVNDGVKFPNGIAKMQALETLKTVAVNKDESMGLPRCKQRLDFLLGLGQLNNLRSLELFHAEWSKAIVSSLCKLGTRNLRSLTIWEGSDLLQEPLGQLVTLEKLIIRYSKVRQVPKWVSSLRNLQHLRLEMEEVKQDDLCLLGALPALLILHLNEDPTDSNESLRISGEIGFQLLRIFIFEAGLHPTDLMFATGSMPKLEKLKLDTFYYDVNADSLDIGIGNLPCLTNVDCVVKGDHDTFTAAKNAMERAASTHPNHPTILFTHYPRGPRFSMRSLLRSAFLRGASCV